MSMATRTGGRKKETEFEMSQRVSKRLRGVLQDQPSNQDIDGDVVVESGSQDPTQGMASGEPARSSRPSGCKLTQEEIDAIEAKVDKYKLEAQKAERALPENVTVTGHELEAATRAAVRFVLMNNSNSEGGLLSGRDLNAQIASVIVQKKGVPAVVVAKTQYVLAKSFGMDLVEEEKVGVKSGGKYYILRSLCPGSVYTQTIGKSESIEVLEKRGMLGFLLALIYMCGSLPEPELFRHMEAVGVAKPRATELLEDAMRKRYVKMDKSSMGSSIDDEVKSYAVAERAVADGLTEGVVLQSVQAEFDDAEEAAA
jgi:hypothetical protein